jgi:circadian clock protein KaiB
MNKRRDTLFKFRLYVAGHAQNSLEALSNLHAICDRLVPTRHEIEVIDVFQSPSIALAEGIFLTPLLVKMEPSPSQRIIGTLCETQKVVAALGLPAHPR